MTLYVSTLGQTQPVELESAVLQGRAPDGGLFVPERLPVLDESLLNDWQHLSYSELAFEVLSLFLDETAVPADDLRVLVEKSFRTFSHPETIAHQTLDDGLIVQELFHGPTLSFKDVAMGFVVNLFDYFLSRRGEKRTLMVATSGDTGPAAAYASIGKNSLSTWVFYPEGLISDEQARQMTTIQSDNVHTVSVKGCRNGSDDLDQLISNCFHDQDFRQEMNLSSVNSINWARVMTQIVHYFYGYLQNANRVGDPVHFSVPSGAFGNMCAGAIARRMGLPVSQMIVANNANGAISQAIQTGRFAKQDIRNTLASAIDISVPMNFWRHVYFCLNSDARQTRDAYEQYESTGEFSFSRKQQAKVSHHLASHQVDDSTIKETIRETWNRNSYLLDPHAAVAVAAARANRQLQDSGPIICLATAHPAKFPMVIREAIGDLPSAAQHHSLENAVEMKERKQMCHFETMNQSVRTMMRAANEYQSSEN